MRKFAIKNFDVKKYDSVLARGLSNGLGEQGSKVCIEAAICETLGLPHGDDPGCVAGAVRSFKIGLNDSNWSSPKARAKGLRDLGLAQLGSLGVVDDKEFAKRLAEKTIRILIPKLFRQIFAGNKELEAAAERCEKEGTSFAASAASFAASDASFAARYASFAARYASFAASDASFAARYASFAASAASFAASDGKDFYLILSANLALEVLRELKSPGVDLLKGVA